MKLIQHNQGNTKTTHDTIHLNVSKDWEQKITYAKSDPKCAKIYMTCKHRSKYQYSVQQKQGITDWLWLNGQNERQK